VRSNGRVKQDTKSRVGPQKTGQKLDDAPYKMHRLNVLQAPVLL